MFHVARDTPFGCVPQKSVLFRRYMVADTDNPLSEEIGLGLMALLFRIYIPVSFFWLLFYYAENQEGDKAPLPW